MYRIGDYVYVDNSRFLIGRIMRISETTTSVEMAEPAVASTEAESTVPTEPMEAKTINVRIAIYMRPTEAKPSRRRRLLAAEVFRTASSEIVPVSKLQGHCLVMPISQFIRSRPKVIRNIFFIKKGLIFSGYGNTLQSCYLKWLSLLSLPQ